MAERWIAPTLPRAGDQLATVLQPSLNRLERAMGETPVRYAGRVVTTSGNIVDTDELILVDATAGHTTMTLPDARRTLGRRFNVKKIDAGANNAVLAGAGTDTVDGAASVTWNNPNQSYMVQSVLVTAPATFGWYII